MFRRYFYAYNYSENNNLAQLRHGNYSFGKDVVWLQRGNSLAIWHKHNDGSYSNFANLALI